jgi:plasmid stability protein
MHVGLIQIRGVSDDAHRRLKARAALAGTSLSEYLRLELERLAALPTLDEMLDRISRREPVGGISAADALQLEREERGR